jgi:predicted NAD/FAD-binding protein
LQSLQSRSEFCVTLNSTEQIDAERVLQRYTYHHPVFTREGIDAQRHHDRLNGQRRTYFCGAYWGYGFHEDGVNSALAVARHFGRSL